MLPFYKDFTKWLTLKPKLDQLVSYPKFQEGDIWWCHIGANVGHEECGKGNSFLRPIIILKKFNHRIFFGLPTSSKLKESIFYRPIMIKGKQVSVLMSQMRLFDVKRLYYKQGKIGDVELLKLKKDFVKLLLK
ncbi:type II toxin-antitoxin system PemK/MazF family toxin [Candidatus Roizmanbacteria bacterium]|nr:type II toxin-antitoxin system PemK/MazF family toxin [Candidatus Roizmanbacteria bacterium]